MLSLVAVVGLAFNATWRPAKAWMDEAPRTMRTLERKLRPVTGFIAKIESVSDQAERVTDPGAHRSAPAVPATATEKKSTIVNTQEWLLAMLTTLMVTYFLLAAGPSLLVKIEVACGAGAGNTRLLRAAAAISDDVSRYFATVTLINLVLGFATTAAMYWLGMPNPLLWGIVAFVLNFIPYAGPATTLALLTVVALVSFDGLGKTLGVAGCYLFLTMIEGQFVQPVLVGRRLDVIPLVVFLCLWFGGWLWGIAEVALAVPLLVTARALGLGLGVAEPAERENRRATGRRTGRLQWSRKSSGLLDCTHWARPPMHHRPGNCYKVAEHGRRAADSLGRSARSLYNERIRRARPAGQA